MARETSKRAESQPSRLTLRLRPEEMRYVRNEAKTQGKTLSDYVRERLLSDCVHGFLESISAGSGGISPELSMNDVKKESGTGGKIALANFPPPVCARKPPAGSAIDREVRGRTGHAENCRCFACTKLRGLLGETRLS